MRRNPLARFLRTRPGTFLAAGFAAGLLVVGLRATGLLQNVELDFYDVALRVRSRFAPPDARIVLVRIEERDIQEFGHPVPDEALARALENLLAGDPRVVGVDLVRDLPVPPGTEPLAAVLVGDERIVGVDKFPDADGTRGIDAPPALRGTERVGFSDQYLDGDAHVRRGLLFVSHGGESGVSFALQLASRYLDDEGIAVEPDPADPDLVRLGGTTIARFGGDDGAYVRAEEGGYQFLLDYRAALGFPSFRFGDVVAGRIPRDAVRDRIVVVGTTATSVKDLFMSPVGPLLGGARQLYGLEIHAHQTSQLLRFALDGHAPIRVASPRAESFWILAWALAGAALGTLFPGFGWLGLSLIAGMLAVLGAGAVGFVWGWWVPVVPPLLAFAAGASAAVAAVLRAERIDRDLLRALFNSYVSESVVERLWREREAFLTEGRPRSRRVMATLLMADLEGYTSAAEGMEPEEVMAWVSQYMSVMARIIDAHDGIVGDYAGDGIKADFGVLDPDHPEDVERSARNAVECALEMTREMARLNAEWKQEGRPTVRLRIGIHTGPVVVGSVGSATRLSYTSVGDTVNTASRIEGFDKEALKESDEGEHRILVSGQTFELLGEGYRAEWLGEHRFRGKTKAVSLHRVLGHAATQEGEGA